MWGGAVGGEGSHTCKEMTKGKQIFFLLGTLNVNSLKVVRKRRNILRQLRSHCDATCFQESKLDGASANDVAKTTLAVGLLIIEQPSLAA
jgi:hypothetical protein